MSPCHLLLVTTWELSWWLAGVCRHTSPDFAHAFFYLFIRRDSEFGLEFKNNCARR
ncbi:hypothetical protein K443DRAFT_673706 [Laccaria amethystina LaAM-08-1]|uniref:Uncharacterized protein n=1 Tax=Laccaria amethystina LaAM-08-1 TaxID=1095629 RepID=A0A0C9XPW3_9AGAR|nr:hypothetical protein K443DRAFT_673706 [Laccaria amethystina LaAM-08-1]